MLKKLITSTTALIALSTLCAAAAHADDAPPDNNAQSYPAGYIPVPYANTGIKFGGYARLDVFEDLNSTLNATSGKLPAQAAGATPPNGTGQPASSRGLNWSAAATRFNVATLTHTDVGDIGTMIEIDFAPTTASNYNITSIVPRLRLAYGTYKNWLAGQNYSTFDDLPSIAPTLDFNTSMATEGTRVPQIRYTVPLNKASYLDFAAEANTGFYSLAYSNVAGQSPPAASNGTAASNFNPTVQLPDFVAKYTIDGSWGHFGLSGMGGYIQNGTFGGANSNGAFGWGTTLGLVINTIGKDAIYIQSIDGTMVLNGFTPNGAENAAYVNVGTNKVSLVPSYSAQLGYNHYFSEIGLDKWSLLVVGGLLKTVGGQYSTLTASTPTSNGVFTNGATQIAQVHTNLIWHVTPATSFGLEYTYSSNWSKIATYNAATGVTTPSPLGTQRGDASRLQFTAMYKF